MTLKIRNLEIKKCGIFEIIVPTFYSLILIETFGYVYFDKYTNQQKGTQKSYKCFDSALVIIYINLIAELTK